jgi:protein SCO1/2
VSGYLFGVNFSPSELLAALRRAGSEQVGARLQELFLLCFHYNPINSRYGPVVVLSVRILGLATVAGLVWLIGIQIRQARGRAVLLELGPGQPEPVSGVAAAASTAAPLK